VISLINVIYVVKGLIKILLKTDHDGMSQTVDWIHVSCTYVARALVLADLALSLISWNVDGICSAGKNWYELTMVRVCKFCYEL
jgi:uncharacterized membrane protein YhdT